MMTSQHLYRLIHDLYLFMNGVEERILATLDLTSAQFRLLSLLDPDEGKSLNEITTRLFCARSTAVRLVDSLERARQVYRVVDPDNHRINRVHLTPMGSAARQQAIDAIAQAFDQHVQVLSPDEQAIFTALFKRVRDHYANDFEGSQLS